MRRTTGKKKVAAPYDAAEFLETEEDVAAYLNAALEDGNPQLLTAALGDVARAKGMTQLAQETGITRDGLYKALSPSGNPSFATVQKVVNALGFRFDVTPNNQVPALGACNGRQED
ncbi:MAG: putative addiction module antidote protein [Olsenella sp.]|nr:putative addiction module antidote protein [Olsenella sp.]